MQIPEIERMLDDLEAAANAVEAYGAARRLPWRRFMGDDEEDAGGFVTLTPDQTRRLVAVARAYLRPSRIRRGHVTWPVRQAARFDPSRALRED
jgi:hypothetical protein